MSSSLRTVARKFSIGGHAFVQGGFTLKIDQNSTDYRVSCFNLGVGALSVGAKLTRALVATGLSEL